MKRTLSGFITALVLSVVAAGAPPLDAHPEFQLFSQTHSGRFVNCSMCHSHPDGPEGVKAGQIGSLTPAELELLGRSRAAFEPGTPVDSPILNEFGNHILTMLGKKKILELRTQPQALADLLGTESDLDADGISDAREYLEGTHPLVDQHGDPGALFVHNFKTRFFDIAMLALATIAGLYGLNHLLRWFAGAADRWAAEASDE